MSDHHAGFRARKLTERPEGYPDIGEEFECQYPSSTTSSETGRPVHRYRVIGWEEQIDGDGNTRVIVRTHPVDIRVRPMTGYRQCDMGHWHPTFGGAEPIGAPPDVWGFGGELS